MTSGKVTTLAGSGVSTYVDGQGQRNVSFYYPTGITMDARARFAILADNHVIRRVTIAAQPIVTVVAGQVYGGYADGFGTDAIFYWPYGVAMDASGTVVIVADYWNSRIRRINVSSTEVVTLAGSTYADGVGSILKFYKPWSVAVDAEASVAFIVS
jgi:uncharacterized membrane protein YedE/YeeE